jgi:hypothetical protein
MGSSGMVVCPPVWCIRSSCLLQQLRSAKMKFLQLDCKTFCINTKTGSAVLDVLNMPVYARKSGDEAFEDKEAWFNKNSHLSAFHHEGDIVAGKYTIVGVLGQGGAGTTYEAKTPDGEVVALKALSLRNMRGWKVCSCLKQTGACNHVVQGLWFVNAVLRFLGACSFDWPQT